MRNIGRQSRSGGRKLVFCFRWSELQLKVFPNSWLLRETWGTGREETQDLPQHFPREAQQGTGGTGGCWARYPWKPPGYRRDRAVAPQSYQESRSLSSAGACSNEPQFLAEQTPRAVSGPDPPALPSWLGSTKTLRWKLGMPCFFNSKLLANFWYVR